MRATVEALSQHTVRQYDELEAELLALREADPDVSGAHWTLYALAAQDAMGLATDSLRRSLSMLGRLRGIVHAEVARLNQEKRKDECRAVPQ